MSTFLFILLGILVFGLLIAVHEFGHFITAKLCGVRVNEFAIGMGPKLLSRQGKETLYTLRLFPVGGFCAMEGEDEDTEDPRSFQKTRWWKKLLILLAGAFMNFVAGVLIFFFLFLPMDSFQADIVGGFESWSALPAQGLQEGDRFLKVDGHRMLSAGDAKIFLDRAGKTADIEVLRDGQRVLLKDVSMTRQTVETQNGTYQLLGLTIGSEAVPATFGTRVKEVFKQSASCVRLVWVSLGDLFTGAVGLRDLSGPVGIVSMIGEVGAQAQDPDIGIGLALESVMNLMAFIAINLAVMNLLPIPALDGGRIFFLFINGVYTFFTHKKLNPKYEGIINAVGLILLLGLMVVVAVSDVFKLFGR